MIRVLATLTALTAAGPAPAQDDGWIPLFNGRDLDGWTPKIAGHPLGEDPFGTFRVENGVLKVSYDKYEKFDNRFGHLFYKAPYSRYRLRIEYRFVGEQCPGGPGWALRNSGVMVHGQPPETMRKDQSFPVSIEVQFLGGNGKDPRPTGNLCTPGTHVVMDGKLLTRHCTNSRSKTVHGDAWVTAEVEVLGSTSIKHFIDGEAVLEYAEPQYDEGDADARALIREGRKLIEGGSISLQAESHPIEFRKVELKKLP
ncbi:MAG TPA: DUF1080 domain-containing protein [Planctomycetota bacterium]|nr:DUF1080 domain-containing protein [Planctomycetota bacterium]